HLMDDKLGFGRMGGEAADGKLVRDEPTLVPEQWTVRELGNRIQFVVPSVPLVLHVDRSAGSRHCPALFSCIACRSSFAPSHSSGPPFRQRSFFALETPSRCSSCVWPT